jgi:hypothetical protein
MKRANQLLATTLALVLGASPAFAQDAGEDDGDLDVTMRLLPANAELPDAATREIELPVNDEGEFRASEQGIENSLAGIETANAAREDGRAFGQEAAAAAQENRENMGRGSRPDLEELLPEQVPNVPEIPDRPDRPETPELPEVPGGPPGE